MDRNEILQKAIDAVLNAEAATSGIDDVDTWLKISEQWRLLASYALVNRLPTTEKNPDLIGLPSDVTLGDPVSRRPA